MSKKFYLICDDDCKYEGMTKEQIFAAIAEATGNVPNGVDDAFISSVVNQNSGGAIKLWMGTTAEYNILKNAGNLDEDTYYIRTDGGEIETVDVKSGGTGLTAVGTNNFIAGTGTEKMQELSPAEVRALINALPKNPTSIEMIPPENSAHGGFIDFHYNGSTKDYTSRIIESAQGVINITPALQAGGSKVMTAANFTYSNGTLTITTT